MVIGAGIEGLNGKLGRVWELEFENAILDLKYKRVGTHNVERWGEI